MNITAHNARNSSYLNNAKTCLVLLLATCLSFSTYAKDTDDIKISRDSTSLPRSSNHADVTLIPLGTAEFPGHCEYRGHAGKLRCLNINTIKHGSTQKSACPGKGLYLSRGKCYTCPKGYKRSAAIKQMTNNKACVKHQRGKNPKSAGIYKRKAYLGCPSGQFKQSGKCYSCPAKSKRKHFAGIDSLECKVEKAYHCNTGLSLHKAEPTTKWESFGNVIGSKKRKFCGEPFNYNNFAIEAAANETNQLIGEAIIRFGIKMAKDDSETKEKVKNLKRAIKDKRLKEAYNILTTFDEFVYLEEAAHTGQQLSITVGIVADGSAVLGANVEYGIAIDIGQRKLISYKAKGLTSGISAGVDVGIGAGVWSGEFKSSYAQGVVVGFGEASLGVWTDYYTPKRADGLNQPHLIGFTGSAGVGLSAEIGEYNEVYTETTNQVNCSIESGFRLDC